MKVTKMDGDTILGDECVEVLWKPRLAGIQCVFRACYISACQKYENSVPKLVDCAL